MAARCDGDTLPVHRPVSRAMQLGLKVGRIDPVVGWILGPVPFRGPFGIGHECVGQVVAKGDDVRDLAIGQTVVVPWAVSCGSCTECRRGVTAKCSTTRVGELAAYGFGEASGPWGGMVADEILVPYADHMLVPVPDGVDPLRVAAASDNLADAWRTVVPPLAQRPGGSVLVIGGGAQSIGLYAAGLAVAHGASVVDYVDDGTERLEIAESFGARVHRIGGSRRRPAGRDPRPLRHRRQGLFAGHRGPRRAALAEPWRHLHRGRLLPGPHHQTPLMHMYATDATLHLGVSSVRATPSRAPRLRGADRLPSRAGHQGPRRLGGRARGVHRRTTKLVLHRSPLDLPVSHA